MITRRTPLSSPLDLGQTLAALRQGLDDPTVRLAAGDVWRASRTPDGPVTVHLAVDGTDLVAEAWGPGAEWAVEQVPELVGLTDDPTGFDPSLHPVVARLHHAAPGLRLGRTTRVVEALVGAVLGQRVTVFEARRAFRLITMEFGEVAPGPGGLWLLPDPQRLAGIPYYDLHRTGVERGRADTVRRVCAQANQLEDVLELPPHEATRRLTTVAGVGPWTAAHVSAIALGDPDAVPIGDYGLPSHVSWVLTGEPQADDDRMLELLEPWRGHRGRVVRLVTMLGDAPPRRAPRAAIPDIANF
jgi:3-methyladenine DNA glycosylase/8-oxoguanine DNA glycosylase